MLAAIRQYFDTRIAARAGDDPAAAAHKARVAAAALLVEVVRADHHIGEAERAGLLAAAQRKFGLDPDEAAELMRVAEQESRESVDLYQFTTAINAQFDAQQKQRLIEELWRVAFADATLHAHEEYVIRKVADLIHLPHSAFIAAKLRVTEGGP